MAKLVLDNVSFDFDLGCKIARLKYKECPENFNAIQDIWDDIIPAKFSDIAQLPNLEQRRIGIRALGLERLIAEVNPTLLNKTTLKKSNMWVNENGVLETFDFEDTYELYEVKGEVFSQGLKEHQKMADCHYIRCKDTSTDREYLIWVDLQSVWDTNNPDKSSSWNRPKDYINKINAIDAISWTITVNIKLGEIEEIYRQGDCILVKPKQGYTTLDRPRHLTAQEYRTLMVAES